MMMMIGFDDVKTETQILIRLDESIRLSGTVQSKHYQPIPPQVQAQIDSTW